MIDMEQSKIDTEEIRQKIPESPEGKKEISLESIDEALIIEEGILDSLNKYSKDEFFKDIDLNNNLKFRGVGVVDEKFDEAVYGKATLSEKILNFATLGLAKEDLGLMKSKERGLLNKDVFNKEMKGKEIEIGQNKEERISMEKIIGNMHKELSAEDLEKRQITKSFEVVDGKIIKIVQTSRTEQGMIDAAGKLLNEKIESLEKGVGVDLVKEKEGLEKHHSSIGKFDKTTEHLSEATKKELGEKIKQEGVEYQERIKEKEENLQSELDIFRNPFQERLDKTNELVDNFSGMLKDTKEAESNYNAKLKSINANIQEAQKSGLLEESKKELIKELELKKAEFEGKAKEFGVRKIDMEAKLGILKNNKTELEKTISRINGIGKTKKEIAEEKTAKEKTALKAEKTKTIEKNSDSEFAEDWSFMKEKNIPKVETEINTENDEEETDNANEEIKNNPEKIFTEKEIEDIVKTHLKVIGLSKIQDKKIQDQITRNAVVNIKKMIEKNEEPMTEIYIRKETKRVFDALSASYFKKNK